MGLICCRRKCANAAQERLESVTEFCTGGSETSPYRLRIWARRPPRPVLSGAIGTATTSKELYMNLPAQRKNLSTRSKQVGTFLRKLNSRYAVITLPGIPTCQ